MLCNTAWANLRIRCSAYVPVRRLEKLGGGGLISLSDLRELGDGVLLLLCIGWRHLGLDRVLKSEEDGGGRKTQVRLGYRSSYMCVCVCMQ